MKTLKLAFLQLAFLCVPAVAFALPVDCNIFFNGSNAIQVAWNSTPGSIYRLQTTTNIAGPWQDALPEPGTITATNSQIFQSIPVSPTSQFYRVTQLDTDGPEIYQVSPLDGGIAIGQQAILQASLRDETGINTNTISLSIGTNPPIALADSRLTFTNNTLTYTPGTNELLGALGSSVTVRVSASDTLGNLTTNFTWTFQLQLPTVPAANILLVNGTNDLTLVSTNGDSFTFSYPDILPGLTNGTHLIDTDPINGFTRTVLSFTNDPASNSVVILTRVTKLAELLQQGSLSSDGFVEIVEGAQHRIVQIGIPLNHSFGLEQVVFQDANFVVELLADSFLGMDGTLNLSANFESNRLTHFESTLSGTVDFRLNAHAGAQGALDRAGSKPLIQPVRKTYATVIGYVPVWVDVVFELNAGYTAHMEASADYSSGVAAMKEFQFGRRWNVTNGWSEISQNSPLGFSFLGPEWQVQASGNLRVYLQPKVTLLVYSAAGVWGNLQPYADLVGNVELNPEVCPNLSLYAGLKSTLALDLRVWDDSWGDLPTLTLDLIPRALLGKLSVAFGPPSVSEQPTSQAVVAGQIATLSVQTCGSEPLNYRWQKNGLNLSDDHRISGSRSATLQIINVRTNDAGIYRLLVNNDMGTTNSQDAILSVVPNGMAFIPAGSFTMGNSLTPNEGNTNELPLHTVYVSAFYMDRYEVTKALWDEVYSWAITNGYSFEYAAQGTAANHPAQSMAWYDAVKWCNARSEKEGRVPAYYMSAEQTTVYRTGQVHVENDWVKWNSGYRLPTEAEWEKAARGGSSGQRFPWGDTITHSRANYYSVTNYAHDTSPTRGVHPTFSLSTSPVGYFGANGYGLYDMAGNVWEWCWDWHSGSYYSSSSGTDPRGPTSGLGRVTRGGARNFAANSCRAAARNADSPIRSYVVIGFRSVLPPDQ